MAQDPYRYFRPEAREILEQFSRDVLDLEKGESNSATVQRLLRLAHTLKGAARVVKQSDIANRAHEIEEVLSPLRESGCNVGRDQIDAVLHHIDAISDRLAALAPADVPSAPAAGKQAIEEASRTVRTDVAEADAVLDSVVETHTLVNILRAAVRGVQQAAQFSDLLASYPATDRSSGEDSSSRSHSGNRSTVAEELSRKMGAIGRNLEAAVDQMDRELRQLREAVERLRLVPVGSLFTTLERMARDTARAQGKHVSFEAGGGAVRLDAHILDSIQGALVQIVRNAVAHGIETGDERARAGKPAVGRVSVDVFRRDRRIVFSCSDDGRGINLDAVRRAALQRGLIGSETTTVGPDALLNVLLRGGISTSKTVTEESGRGIGLDVVRESVERLGGEVVCRSEPGAGTTFEIAIPPALASIDALIVEVSDTGAVVAIPLDAVRSTRRLSSAQITPAASGASVLYNEEVVPFVPLAAVLGAATWSPGDDWTAIVIATGDGLAMIGVKRLLGTGKIVVRPLPQHVTAGPVVLAATLDVDGNPQLVINPDELIAAARRGCVSESSAQPQKRPVLVVDDSLTTRMLEQSILESAGYDVDLAVSGEQALERVRQKTYALILVDVEMPGMDGFTFIERIRSDRKTCDVPAILVTSLAKPEHRARSRRWRPRLHRQKRI
jgi:two-component system, chemotaxis family, sensor kinase CheA